MKRDEADALARQITRNTTRHAIVKPTGDYWFVLVYGVDGQPVLVIEDDVLEAAKLLYEAGVPLGVPHARAASIGPAPGSQE